LTINQNANFHCLTQVSAEDFNILVEYLEDLVGKARQSTVEHAEKTIAEAEDEESSVGKSNCEVQLM